MCRRLKHLRDTAGYTQKSVADYLSISQAAYSRLEKGEIEIGLTKLFALSELYRVSVSKLMEDI
jgi:transcriptional regulator with XRE-family HTH domain